MLPTIAMRSPMAPAFLRRHFGWHGLIGDEGESGRMDDRGNNSNHNGVDFSKPGYLANQVNSGESWWFFIANICPDLMIVMTVIINAGVMMYMVTIHELDNNTFRVYAG